MDGQERVYRRGLIIAARERPSANTDSDCDTTTRRTRRFRIFTHAIAPVLSALVPSTASPPP